MTDIHNGKDTQCVDPRFATPDTLFFVIGAQKCGTTWLSDYLRGHPQVCMPDWKEHNYWNMVAGAPSPGRKLTARKAARDKQGRLVTFVRDFGFTGAARRNRGTRRALAAAATPHAPHSAYADSLFAHYGHQHKAVGEISPAYASLSHETFAHMAQLAPNVRFILLMRDPLARVISGVRQKFSVNRQSGELTQDMMHETIDAMLLGQGQDHPLRASRYDETITQLEQAVPAAQIGYFFFETFFDQTTVAKVCDFIGVDPFAANITQVVHPGKGKQARVDDAHRRRVVQNLAPTYQALRQKFGDTLPAAWSVSEALIDHE